MLILDYPFAELDEPMFSKSPSLRQRHKLLDILVIICLLSVVCCLLYVVCCMLSVVCCVVCCLLSVVTLLLNIDTT